MVWLNVTEQAMSEVTVDFFYNKADKPTAVSAWTWLWKSDNAVVTTSGYCMLVRFIVDGMLQRTSPANRICWCRFVWYSTWMQVLEDMAGHIGCSKHLGELATVLRWCRSQMLLSLPVISDWLKYDPGYVGARASVSGHLVLLIARDSSLWLWLFFWGHRHAAEWIRGPPFWWIRIEISTMPKFCTVLYMIKYFN